MRMCAPLADFRAGEVRALEGRRKPISPPLDQLFALSTLELAIHAQTGMAESAQQATVREKAISEDEAKLYDRQLRLWGAAAQARMLASNVLFAGRFRGIAVDAVKNVVLAGVGALTLLDGEDLEPEDLGADYFATEHDIGQKVRTACVLFLFD